VASTTTSSSGQYSFSNVAPGTYSVVFHAPSGYNFSPAQQGSNPAVDSDVVNAATGETGTFTLVAGQVKNDVDAGLVPGADPFFFGSLYFQIPFLLQLTLPFQVVN